MWGGVGNSESMVVWLEKVRLDLLSQSLHSGLDVQSGERSSRVECGLGQQMQLRTCVLRVKKKEEEEDRKREKKGKRRRGGRRRRRRRRKKRREKKEEEEEGDQEDQEE